MAKLDVTLNEEYFGVQPNVPLMHQVVTAQLAKRRAGTQSTKTRSEVRGGGAKPFRQKGTGRARQGSTNAPHYAGGGVALGPKPRSYAQRTPKKMIKLALRSALSDRAGDDKVLVVDAFGWAEPSTKQAVGALDQLGVSGRTLVVLERQDAIAALSFRNLPEVQVINVGELNAYDVLCNDWIVFTQGALSALTREDLVAESPSDAEPAEGASDVELTDDQEAPTASAPDRSDDDMETGVASASEQPDASEASREHRSAGTAGRERSEPQPSSDEPDASDSEPAS
jgi:large subunit ribosomal protein L4